MQLRAVSRVITATVQAVRMTACWRALKRVENQAGQSLVEYSMIIALVIVVLIIIVMLLGNQVQNLYCNISGGVGA